MDDYHLSSVLINDHVIAGVEEENWTVGEVIPRMPGSGELREQIECRKEFFFHPIGNPSIGLLG